MAKFSLTPLHRIRSFSGYRLTIVLNYDRVLKATKTEKAQHRSLSELSHGLKKKHVQFHQRSSARSLVIMDHDTSANANQRCRLLVVGGGSGGCSMAAKLSRKLPINDVIVLEPSDTHYYQPMFTLVGAGLRPLRESHRPMANVLPRKARWLKDEAETFIPQDNEVLTKGGKRIKYDFMLIALGIKPDYEKIPGLKEALATEGTGVSCNYCPQLVEKSFKYLKEFNGGHIISTYPYGPIKCPGAPQKYLYLADDYLRRKKIRQFATICYHTALSKIFAVPYYSESMQSIADSKDIKVEVFSELVEVRGDTREAVFRRLYPDEREHELTTEKFTLLHATPPQAPPRALRLSTELVHESSGFLEVNPRTLQHVRFDNVFGVGDALHVPTSRTAASVAAQCGVLRHTLGAALQGRQPPSHVAYDGYASCPLVTRNGSCVLAEFKYNGVPAETFPVDQRLERWFMYQIKARFLPQIYWNLMLRGYWDGPKRVRNIFRLGGLI